MIFTPEKGFYKLFFGVKITLPNNSTVRSYYNSLKITVRFDNFKREPPALETG